MGVRKLKPTTPGQRHRSVNDFAVLSSVAPEKSLTLPNRRSGGRNNTGKMTMRYVGGGAKQRYRIVDFKREKFNIPATVKSIEYDPNRTAFIALLVYATAPTRSPLRRNQATMHRSQMRLAASQKTRDFFRSRAPRRCI